MKKALLFIGGGLEAVPGIVLAQKMGHYAVVSDANEKAPGCVTADYVLKASTYDVQSSLRAAMNFHKKVRPISGVMSVASDIPLTVATISNELELPGIPIKSAKLASDKLAMKQQFAHDGVAIPWYSEIFGASDLVKIIAKYSEGLVIKPIDSRGARGVLRINSRTDLEWAFSEALKYSPAKRVMVEEFIDGPQVSTESLIINGEALTPGFSDRNYEFLNRYSPYIIENGGDLPSFLPENVQLAVKELVGTAARSMGIYNGIIKGDIVIRKGNPLVIELAARLSGGYFCTHEIPLNTGVDLVGQAIKLALGEKVNPKDLKEKYSRAVSQRYLFPNPGRVVSISGVNQVTCRPSVALCEVRVKVGDEIAPINNHPERAGVVIATGTTRKEAMSAANSAIEDIKIITK